LESLYFDLLKLGYHLGLAILVGGSLVLGSAAAPAIFRTVPERAQAGAVFGAALARFDGLAILALLLVGLTATLRAISFETVDLKIALRWVFLLLAGLATLYASAWSNPVARAIRQQTPNFDELPEASLARREFAKLHRRSRAALRAVVVFGLAALFLS
jgi:hypothetical protein